MPDPLAPTAEIVLRLLALIDALCGLLAEQAALEASGAPVAILLTFLRSRLRPMAEGLAQRRASTHAAATLRSSARERINGRRAGGRASAMRQAKGPPRPTRTRPHAPAVIFG